MGNWKPSLMAIATHQTWTKPKPNQPTHRAKHMEIPREAPETDWLAFELDGFTQSHPRKKSVAVGLCRHRFYEFE